MNTFYFKNLLAAILLTAGSLVFSQVKEKQTFYTNDITINYPSEHILEDINTVSILNDSMINVSGNDISNAQLNINKINSISMQSGSYTLLGIGLGTLAGLGIGALIVASTKSDDTDPVGTLVVGTGNVMLGGLSVIAGAVIGGIIGGNISSQQKYDLHNYKYDKKKELERILKKTGKGNQ